MFFSTTNIDGNLSAIQSPAEMQGFLLRGFFTTDDRVITKLQYHVRAIFVAESYIAPSNHVVMLINLEIAIPAVANISASIKKLRHV